MSTRAKASFYEQEPVMRRMCKKRRENDRFGVFCFALFMEAKWLGERRPIGSGSE